MGAVGMSPTKAVLRQLRRLAAAGKLLEHTLPPPTALRPVQTLLDVGAGIRPVPWNPLAQHTCMEPYAPYVAILRRNGCAVIQADALTGLSGLDAGSYDAVYMLDVIEHMERGEAQLAIAEALRVATVQVVLYTPLGFVAQVQDAWGLGGEAWQTHRSGWGPEEFSARSGWTIETPTFATEDGPAREGFFALWNREAA